MHKLLSKPHNKKVSNSITFYALHLPILAVLALLLVLGGYFSVNRVGASYVGNDDADQLGLVLGDEEEDDDEEEEEKDEEEDDNSGSGSGNDDEDEDEDEDEHEDEDEDENEDEDEDENEDEDEDEDEDEFKPTNSGPGSFDDDDDEEEDDDDEDEREFKIVERTANEDGTVTVVIKEFDDGEIKTETRTYDAAGNKIMVEKYEKEDGEEKVRVKTYDENGEKETDFRLETEDGKELKLRLKEGELELARVVFDIDDQKLVVREGDDEGAESKFEIKVEDDGFRIIRSGAEVLSTFPMTVDDVTGKILVSTPVGEIELMALPDSIVQKAVISDDLAKVESLELESDDSSEDESELKYIVTGSKSESLLGVFKLELPTVLVYDAETGELVKSEQTFMTKVLDLFSF